MSVIRVQRLPRNQIRISDKNIFVELVVVYFANLPLFTPGRDVARTVDIIFVIEVLEMVLYLLGVCCFVIFGVFFRSIGNLNIIMVDRMLDDVCEFVAADRLAIEIGINILGLAGFR